MTLRTIVVDDSLLFRKVMRDALGEIDGIDVIDAARDGLVALDKITLHRPDLVTLDIEMPGLNGIEVLKALDKRGLKTRVIVVSSQTRRGAEVTTQALAMGAFDFILKPEGGDLNESLKMLRQGLEKRISLLMPKHKLTRQQSIRRKPGLISNSSPTEQRSRAKRIDTNHLSTPKFPTTCKAVFIGISTGGPKALANVVPKIPSGFPAPIIVVQHMPPLFTATLANSLDKTSGLQVYEATNGMPMVAGGVYVAPGGKQLGVCTNTRGDLVAEVNNAPPVKSCKPSVDYMLASVPNEIAKKSLAIIMTGMGDDGRDGCEKLRAHGATVWAQSESTCTVYGMPRQVVESGLADSVFDLESLPSLLSQLAKKSGLVTKPSIAKSTTTVHQSLSTNPLSA